MFWGETKQFRPMEEYAVKQVLLNGLQFQMWSWSNYTRLSLWSLQRTSLPSFTKYHRTPKPKIRSTCLQKQGRNYACSKALICHHIRGKLHIRLKLARLDSLSWTTVSVCARTQTRMHTRWLKPALTYISGWWQAAAGKWVCGAQTEKTHCSQTRAAGLRWASRNTPRVKQRGASWSPST